MKTLLQSAALGLALVMGLAPQTRAADKPEVVRITYVSSPFNVPSIVMRAKGYLEEAFKPFGIRVESPEITSGAAQVQAIAAGEIQIASVLGGTSAILGKANGADVQVIAAYSRSPKAFGILARGDGPSSVADLKGKTVAGPKGTTLHQLLAAALAKAGLTLSDVNHVNMDLGAARAALLAGKVDAATLAGNNALAVEQAGGKIIANGDGIIAPTTVIGVRGEFLRNHPDLVEAYLAAHRKALDFMAENPDEALKLAAEEQKISLDDARRMMGWYDFSIRMTDKDVANLADEQAFMVSSGMLKKTIDIKADLIAPKAFELK
ncbi:sulfonate transport system substrate-binding protein [Microvirga flocculans]|uniref:Sulfonate transport system substrate-binding protein n=1 Tax=Microvirga flocculans TaxID=217168 RepID=A0A7W6N803_9HYPH|nr:NrtA/SsuA/CpmA family ABC transporter substrate-binding protein [Microvirga flocculans]MBB4040187.1 sulfonate transport system substrate-binding protein [Microvirga flocculans]